MRPIWALVLVGICVRAQQDLSWKADIVATQRESEMSEQDALTHYFGDDKRNITLFPTWDAMKDRVGNFINVNSSKLKNHDYNEMTAWLKGMRLNYPNLTHLYSAGKSVEGRELWVLIVSDKPKEHELLEPELKIVGNMHGNEVVGREAVLYLAEILCLNYGKNQYLTDLVNNARIHLMPSMNPDGYELGFAGDRISANGRANANGVDLNRNFPTKFPEHRESSGGSNPEQENIEVMKWLQSYPFVLSTNLHGGSLVANYPYDDSVTGQDGIYTASADDKLFVELSYRYARAHTKMWKTGRRCGLSADGDNFINGITNGAGWYHLAGGMQDWQYEHTNCLEITIEMGCFKFPTNDMIPSLWEEHQYSLLSFLEMGLTGVTGLITDRNNMTVANATISVDTGKDVISTEAGEYWRLLPPGDHQVTVSARGLESDTFTVTVQPGQRAVRHDITLLACGENETKSELYVRGRGKNLLAVISFDEIGGSVVDELARITCTGDFVIDKDLSLMLIPKMSDQLKPRLFRFSPAALLIISEGIVETVTFSASDNQPRLFNKSKMDESLLKALGNSIQCDRKLLESKLALRVDDLQLSRAFELGISVGCDATDLEKKAATIGTIADMIKNELIKDSVSEFSVVPSAHPGDHFTPDQMIHVTSAGVAELARKECVQEVSRGSNKLFLMGSGKPPYTLIAAVEKRTEAMAYEMMSTYCNPDTKSEFSNILDESTLVFMPEIPHTQLNCHDYDTISPFKLLFDDAIAAVPQLDFVIILATGGIKVRYINDTIGAGKQIAEAYRSNHDLMKSTEQEGCAKGFPNEKEAIRAFSWNDNASRMDKSGIAHATDNLDALLVQIGCCYENMASGHLYSENQNSMKSALMERARGVRIIGGVDGMTVSVYHLHKSLPLLGGRRFVPLPNGEHLIRVRTSEGQMHSQFSVLISDRHPTAEKYIGVQSSNMAIITIASILMIVACTFMCRQRVTSVLNRRGFFNGIGSKRGFERIPLYKSDDEDEDELFDLQKL